MKRVGLGRMVQGLRGAGVTLMKGRGFLPRNVPVALELQRQGPGGEGCGEADGGGLH